MSDQIMLLSDHKLKMFGQAINPRKVLKALLNVLNVFFQ